jgi:hypothetical protein
MPQGCHGRPDARPPARTEQIVSALESKLDALKEDVNEYWRLDAAFARIRRRQALEIARSSLAARVKREGGGGNKLKLNVRWSDFLIVCCREKQKHGDNR